MRKFITMLALVLLALSLGATGAWAGEENDDKIPSHPDQLEYPPLDYPAPQRSDYRHVLSNGVVAYLVEDHDLPLFEVTIYLRAGDYLDPPGKAGLASAMGSLLRSGGSQSLQPEEYDEEADFLAALISSRLGDTSGQASVNALSKDMDKALGLFFDMLRTPGFDQKRIDLYMRQSLQQMERRNDNTSGIEFREWRRLLYGDDFFSTRYSTKESLESITRQDLLDFHARYIHPANFIIAASGDFDSEALIAKLESAMQGWPEGETAPPVPEPDFQPQPGLYMVNKDDVNQGRASIGHLGITRDNPDVFAIQMMNDVLGGSGFTSRITNRVRSDEGLAYSAGSAMNPGTHYRGQFRALFQSKSTTVAQAIQIVLEEIERIRSEPVQPDELETVKVNAIETFPRQFSSAESIASTFANDELIGREEDYWNTYRDRLRAVTVEDVQRVAQQYLHPDQLVILVVGNVEEIMKGHPDRPEFSISKLPGGENPTMVPLPDPLTMEYGSQ
ncbi:MAG TPA: pitrilysin family protein [Acidobacteriota bacterium]|nr:pitrilysin family protein [Acidobacteriota bacterium]